MKSQSIEDWDKFSAEVSELIADCQPEPAFPSDLCKAEIRKIAELDNPSQQDLLKLARFAQLLSDSIRFDRATAMKYLEAGKAVRTASFKGDIIVLAVLDSVCLSIWLKVTGKVKTTLPIEKHYLIIQPSGKVVLDDIFPDPIYDEWSLASDADINNALAKADITDKADRAIGLSIAMRTQHK